MAQTFKNHSRYIIVWHFVTPLIILAALTGSIIQLVNSDDKEKFAAGILVLLSFVMLIIWFYSRYFALRAQDRAIRAEENFRHYILTGKPLDKAIRMRQIIALRFASDAEMPGLAQRAIEQKLTTKQIKQAIENWRPDFNRA